jgi:uncharacterized membrane protein
MKVLGLLMAVAGWLLPVFGLALTESTAARLVLSVVGLGICVVGILGVLNPAYVKDAIWKK